MGPESTDRQTERGEWVVSATNITVKFAGLTALSDVSLGVERGEITGLVGPNGAGKSTLFGVLSGLQKPSPGGRVTLLGKDVTGSSAQARARMGLARTFQRTELFLGSTVRDHLVLAYRTRYARRRLWTDIVTAGSLKPRDKSESQRVDKLLDLLTLSDVVNERVDLLPLGTSRLVEVGRALATSAEVVLLDEPMAGLDSHERESLANTLRRTVDEANVSLLLVEHDVGMVLNLSNYIYVLDFGIQIAEGTPAVIRTDNKVRAAYLGDPAGTSEVSESPLKPPDCAEAEQSDHVSPA